MNFVRRLDRARALCGQQLVVLSGFRCERHNQVVGGLAGSAHQCGLAADLRCSDSRFRLRLLDALRRAGFVRLGLASSFVHVDMDPDLPQYVFWLY